jgi:hypothetical protein
VQGLLVSDFVLEISYLVVVVGFVVGADFKRSESSQKFSQMVIYHIKIFFQRPFVPEVNR